MTFQKAAVIIAAAGRGDRLAESTANKPKQFTELGGFPLFIWSLATFMQHPKIDTAMLVVPKQWLEKAQVLLAEHLAQDSGRVTIIPGGQSRQESVYMALEALATKKKPPTYVLIHDAARPFIAPQYIDKIMSKVESGSACTLAISLSDSIRRIENSAIVEEMDRNLLALMQTPQGSDFKLMLEAHRFAQQKKHATTDDAAIIQAYGIDTKVVEGSRLNFKITQLDDILMAKALVESYGWRPGKVSEGRRHERRPERSEHGANEE